MSYLLQRIDWYGDGGSANPESFSDITKVNIKLGSDGTPSTAEITLVNPLDRKESDVYLHKYVNKEQEIKFQEGDVVKIYLAYTDTNREISTSSTSADLIMTAEITEFQVNVEMGKSTIKLSCTDKTFSMLCKLWAFNYDATSAMNAPEIIQDVIRNTCDEGSQDAESFDDSGNKVYNGIYTIDARLMTGTTYPGTSGDPPAYIQTRRIGDNSVFPDVTIAKTFKPVYEFIKDLSTPESTNSEAEISGDSLKVKRNMIYYIDYNNRFHWFYPEEAHTTTLDGTHTAVVTTIALVDATGFPTIGRVQIGAELIDYTGITTNNLTGCTRGVNNTTASAHDDLASVYSDLYIKEGDTSTGHTVYKFKLTKKTFDIVNMVIYNAGQDLYGSGILWYYYDTSTKSKDLKYVYKPWKWIASKLIEQELPATQNGNDNLVKDNTTPGPFTYAGNMYDETTGNYAAGAGITTAWGDVVTSDALYNTAVRNRAAFDDNSVGATKAEALCAKRGSPRWKGTIELKGERFTPGELITFTSASAGILNEELRIKSVTHNIEKTGWFTTLSVEEDERETQAQ